MRITRLQLRNVRRHADLDLKLAPGLTVIRGPNESGKSTIQRALELALTRRVTSGSGDMDGMRSWNTGEEDRPWVRLEFEDDDVETGMRTGSLEKAFRGNKGTVKLEADGETITDPARADEVLADLTGIPSEAFFRSTASVRHHELDGLARDEAALRDRLQASISGGDRGTSRARRKLERAIQMLNAKGDKNPGQLKAAEANLATALAAQRNGETALEQLEQDRDILAQSRDDRAAAEAELTEQRSMLEKARLAERLIAERDQAKERFERYSSAVDVSAQIDELEASHPSSNGLPALREALTKVRASDMRIREIRAALAGEVEVQFEMKAPTPRAWRPTAIAAVALILAGVGIALAAQLQVLPALPKISIGTGPGAINLPGAGILAALLVLIGAIVALVGRRQRIRAQDVRKNKDMRTQEIERRLRGRSMLEQELSMEEVTLTNLLAALDMPDLEAVEALVAAEEAHIGQILRLRAQLEGLVGREPTESLPDLRDKAALDAEQKTGAIEQLGPIAREPRARERLEVAVTDADRALGLARDTEAQARARVEQNAVDAEEVAGHAERAAAFAEQLDLLQRRARVYDAALKALDAAERTTIRTATRYLERRMVTDLERVTAGRYRRVQVDDQDLSLKVFAPERGDWVDVSSLSQGTLDTVYLAARIGLVRLVTGDRRPPLVLDDPFVTLDDERAKRALELLREVSADFQVIYLTTSDRYDSAADAVLELDGPTAVSPVEAAAAT